MRLKSLVLPLVLVLAAGGAWFLLQTSNQGPSDGVPGAGPPTAGQQGAKQAAPAELVSAEANSAAAAPTAERSLAQPNATPGPVVAVKAQPSASPGRVIRGRVVDEASRPIAGARVFRSEGQNRFFMGGPGEQAESPKGEVLTAQDGRFELPWRAEYEIPAEVLGFGMQPRIEVRAEEYAPLRHTLRLPPEGDLDVGDLLLGPGLVINGRVLDHAGNPVVGAQVFAHAEEVAVFGFLTDNARSPDALTDGVGAFQLKSLAFAAWHLRVEHTEQPVKSFSGQPPEQGRTLNGLVLELDRPGSIGGVVTGLPNDPTLYEVRARRVSDGSGFIGGRAERTAPLGSGGRFALNGLDGVSSYDLSVALRSSGENGQRDDFERQLISVTEPKRVPAGTQVVELKYLAPARLCLQVVDDLSGTPIEHYQAELAMGFRVTAEDNGEKQKHPEGRGCLEDLRKPDLGAGFFMPSPTLKVSADGYLDLELAVPELKPGQVAEMGVVRLQPVPRLTVTVVDDASGKPVPDTHVVLRAQPEAQGDNPFESITLSASVGRVVSGTSNLSQSGQTDEAGQVHFNAFGGTKAELIAKHSAFAPLRVGNLTLDTTAPGTLELRLLRGGSLRAQVLDPEGQPVVGGLVEVVPEEAQGRSGEFMAPGMNEETRTATTDSSGVALIQHLAAGNYRVRTKEPRRDQEGPVFIFIDREGGAPKGESVTIVDGEIAEITIRDEPKGLLVGRILESGAVLAGAMVQVSKQGEVPDGLFFGGPSGRCDGNGRFEIKDLTAGEYNVVVTAPSRATPHKLTQRILAGENRLNLDLSVSFLQGRVVDSQGQPLVGVDVSARVVESAGDEQRFSGATIMVAGGMGGGMMEISGGPPAGKGRTDADGHYQLRGVTPGVPVIVEANPGQENPMAKSGKSAAISVEEGRTQTVPDIELEVAGCLEFQAVGADGQALANAFLSFTPKDEEQASDGVYRMLDGEGKARLTGLSAGSWKATVQIMAPGNEGAEHSQDFEVVAGEVSKGLLRFP